MYLGERVYKREMTRRDFLWLVSASTLGTLASCAVNPVTGKRQLMLMSEDSEIKIDNENSPHQFSADYGKSNDSSLNQYLTFVGSKMASCTHRPNVPYSFRVVNAVYVNAYAFPGGSIAVTRGILLSLGNEAELAGLLGHELGHVNARHTAERMSKGMILNFVVAGLSAFTSLKDKKYVPIAAGLGGIGAGMLLARYSRDDERQADSLGMEYMNRAGHNPNGMVGLMEMLKGLSTHKPGTIEIMFSTHPMSEERYHNAKNAIQKKYLQVMKKNMYRDRYMDKTAKLRSIKTAIESMQNGEKMMLQKKFLLAEQEFNRALKQAPYDYAGLVMMAKCQIALNNNTKAQEYAKLAKQLNTKEAQAYHIDGIAKLSAKQFSSAQQDFSTYEKLLPGNPNTIFLKGISLEGMQKKEESAHEYMRYLKIVNNDEQAQHARQRLISWGYIN